MKTKLIGLGILAAVIIAAAAYVFISNSQTVTEINGYVGGEKIGLLEDEEVQELLRDRYRLVIDYAKAGSIDMVTDDAEGRDFLFPSNQTALELYKQVHGDPVKSEIILNTPIVLPQPQGIDRSFPIADDRHIVRHRLYGLVCKADQNGFLFPAHTPWIAELQPIVRLFSLESVLEPLAEQAIPVADAKAIQRDAQGCGGIQKAGGQPPQPAVSQGVVLNLLENRRVNAMIL